MEGWTAADTVSALGLALTLATVIRTAFIAKKTKDAVERTESRVTINQILILIPELKHLERHLQSACNQDDRVSARSSLNDWRLSAGELGGFLESLDPPFPATLTDKLALDLQESLGLAHQARELLFGGKVPVLDATKKLRTVMAVVCEGAARLGAQLKSSGSLPTSRKTNWLQRGMKSPEQAGTLPKRGDSS